MPNSAKEKGTGMTDNENRLQEGWYPRADGPAGWYTAAGTSPADAPGSRQPDKRRRGVRIAAAVVCTLLILTSIAWLLRPFFPRRTEAAAGGAAQAAPEEEIPQGAEDYRSYFAEYYSTSNDVDIPRTEAAEGIVIERAGAAVAAGDLYPRQSCGRRHYHISGRS